MRIEHSKVLGAVIAAASIALGSAAANADLPCPVFLRAVVLQDAATLAQAQSLLGPLAVTSWSTPEMDNEAVISIPRPTLRMESLIHQMIRDCQLLPGDSVETVVAAHLMSSAQSTRSATTRLPIVSAPTAGTPPLTTGSNAGSSRIAPQPPAPSPTIRDLVPIPLQSGINYIRGFSQDGRDGIIALGWRDNGNAHGYDLALVLLEASKGGPWNVVRLESATTQNEDYGPDIVTDAPHTGEDVVKSFRFARGTLNGQPSTFLFIARRDLPEGGIPDPSLVTFDVYRLDYGPEVGTTPDHFSHIFRDRSKTMFCNAEFAMSQRFGLPLRSSYPGRRTLDGC